MRIKFQLKNNLPIFSLAVFAIAFSLMACNKSDDDTATLSDEEVAAVLEGALMSSSGGITDEIADATQVAIRYTEKTILGGDCGETFDSTVLRSVNNASITASYTTTWQWIINCNNLMVPISIDYDRTANGAYETARMISDDNSLSNWGIDNLLTGNAWTLSGSYVRSGNQTSKVRNRSSFVSELTISVNELAVSKSSLDIVSGAATFTLTGSVNGGSGFSYSGSIVFNGNGTATVTINGQAYVIDYN